ncbi:unnamed protein product [Rotaria sp. Silwood2]|nr:unnamed protein product [Rotaria sp. Silwood2]
MTIDKSNKILHQREEVEILEEDELSSKARSTLSEIDKKQKDKREKERHIQVLKKGEQFEILISNIMMNYIVSAIIDFIDDSSESAIDIHRSARQILDKYELNLAGLTAIGADNANVNMGEYHSVFALFRDEKPTLLKGSCYSHILHNSVKHAHKLLSIDIEKHLLKIYAHFSRSAKRIAELKSYYEFYEQDYMVILKYINIRWLSLYISIQRLLMVFNPVKDYFLSRDDDCPEELKVLFSSEEGHCILSFLEHILYIIQKANLKLQRRYLAAVSLHQIIIDLKFNLQQRLNSSFFGISCRLKLSRLDTESAQQLKFLFARFIERVIEYIDEYYLLKKYEAISPFGLSTINEITWNNVTKCIELFQIKNLNEDNLFNEFTEIQCVFISMQNKNISLYEQVQSYVEKKSNPNTYLVTSTKSSLDKRTEVEEDNDEDSNEDSIVSKEIRSDHLWAILLSIKP